MTIPMISPSSLTHTSTGVRLMRKKPPSKPPSPFPLLHSKTATSADGPLTATLKIMRVFRGQSRWSLRPSPPPPSQNGPRGWTSQCLLVCSGFARWSNLGLTSTERAERRKRAKATGMLMHHTRTDARCHRDGKLNWPILTIFRLRV